MPICVKENTLYNNSNNYLLNISTRNVKLALYITIKAEISLETKQSL